MKYTDRPERLRRRPLGRYRYVRLRWRVLFAAVDTVGAAVVAAVRLVQALGAKALGRPPVAAVPDDPRTILLVQLDHLGDAVLSTAMLGPLRRRYPNASIEVLASTSNREVFEAAAEVDRVHVSHVNRFARRGRLGWTLATLWWGLRLRRRRVDLAVDVRGDFPAALILRLSGARRRLGWDCAGGGFLLTDRARFVDGRPEVESRLALLARLGIRPTAGDGPWRPVFRPSEPARLRAARAFEPASQRLPAPPRVVMHIGAGTPAKRWPVEHWRELIARLMREHGACVALVGSRSEQAVAASILGPNPPRHVADWTGRLSLDETAALIEAGDVLVGADSGPAHLAAAVGTPAVVLFSGTNHARQWQPSGEAVCVLKQSLPCSPCHRTRCPRADHPCMRGLLPSRVAAAVEAFCRQAPRPQPEPALLNLERS